MLGRTCRVLPSTLPQYGHLTSALREISASIVRGSAIGPASYIVTASDLTTTIAGNLLC